MSLKYESASEPLHVSLHSQHQTLNSRPQTLNAKPQTLLGRCGQRVHGYADTHR